jgi:hypothetical protein
MRLTYNDPQLFAILGGRNVMIESPLVLELLATKAQEDILLFLEGRFGSVPPDLAVRLSGILDVERLRELAKRAGSCSTLDAFRVLLNT